MKLWVLLLAAVLAGCTQKQVEQSPVPLPAMPPPITVSRSQLIPVPVPVLDDPPPVLQDQAPPTALKYKRTLIAASHSLWGLDAPIPSFGAQVQAESGWNVNAHSPVGAQGLAQFMPTTADWLDDVYPELGQHQPYNPSWALSALVRYDKYLYEQVTGNTECDRMAFALSSYNGGIGWVQKDKALAKKQNKDPLQYWGVVETVNAGRTPAAWIENRNYPARILKTLQPKYTTWGKLIEC